jgi:hypothetical protein
MDLRLRAQTLRGFLQQGIVLHGRPRRERIFPIVPQSGADLWYNTKSFAKEFCHADHYPDHCPGARLPGGVRRKRRPLLDEGNTIPFIARYRKESHGAMDDTTLRTLGERLRTCAISTSAAAR